jgi:hypothetical protein
MAFWVGVERWGALPRELVRRKRHMRADGAKPGQEAPRAEAAVVPPSNLIFVLSSRSSADKAAAGSENQQLEALACI